MLKITIAAPFNSKGRYRGGISAIANSILKKQEIWLNNEIQPIIFETCRIQRNNISQARVDFKNIKNFLAIRKEIVKELTYSNSDCLYYHSSIGIALLKDLLAIKHLKKKLNIPVILHIHFADFDKIISKKYLKRLIMSLLKSCVDHVVFLSNKTMQEFIDNGLDKNKCSVIYNFTTIDFNLIDIEENLNNIKLEKKLLFVGSISNRKGIFDLLNCIKEIEGNYSLNICGGFLSQEDEMLFNDYLREMKGKVFFHSYVEGEKKRQLFKECDVFVLPSYGEGLPVVILEALSAGCCVISTNVGAIPEIIGKENGIIIDPGNKQQLLNALTYYVNLNNEELAKQQLNNYKYSKDFSIEKFINETCDICHRVVGRE